MSFRIKPCLLIDTHRRLYIQQGDTENPRVSARTQNQGETENHETADRNLLKLKKIMNTGDFSGMRDQAK